MGSLYRREELRRSDDSPNGRRQYLQCQNLKSKGNEGVTYVGHRLYAAQLMRMVEELEFASMCLDISGEYIESLAITVRPISFPCDVSDGVRGRVSQIYR